MDGWMDEGERGGFGRLGGRVHGKAEVGTGQRREEDKREDAHGSVTYMR